MYRVSKHLLDHFKADFDLLSITCTAGYVEYATKARALRAAITVRQELGVLATLGPSVRRFLLPILVAIAAVALVALLVFGVAGQGTNTSIDAAIGRGARPTPPDATR